MTLEHFFTSTELKDGLTTPTRVTELLTLMQKEKDINESTRHWSNVAITLATTENKECLDLFVQLDGLSFIDKWLKDAQNDSDLEEELIIRVLKALERLQVDSNRSGIGKTVEGLFCHGNSVVREKAKALVDRWTPVPDGMECDSVAVDNEEKVEQETDKEEIPTHETESAVPDSIPPVEVSDSIPPETDLTGVSDSVPPVAGGDGDPVEAHLAGVSDSTSPVATGGDGGGGGGGGGEGLDVSEMDKDIEDENEKQEIAGAVESTALLPSSTTDADNDTKTEVSEKDEDMIEDSENPKTASNTESEKDDGIESGNNNDSGSDSSFSKKSTKGQDDDLISKRPSDMELDYGIVDPLELARQVAIEIEREVDSNSGGQSCSSSSSSSSSSTSGNGIGIGKEPEVSSGQVETLVLEPEPEPEMEIPPVQESESVPNVEKGFSGFDLNQEFSSEEVGIGIGIGIDNPASASTPISIVSASRPEPATELPISPLQFEGALGWKGSAATSAFRKIPEVEKTFSSSSSHRSDGLNFDLNVTESGDDKTENLFSRDKMPVTSYQETPRRLEKLELDLNSFGGGIGDSTTTTASASGITLDWNRDSRVASSFQTYPPTQSLPFKNIDLNLNDHSNVPNNPFLSKLFNKRDDSVISIFGTQVEVNRKDSNSSSISNSNSNSNSIPPPNGIDFTLGRPGSNSIPTPYPNLPNYTHNGFTMAPMYGPGGPSGGLGGLGGSGGYGSIPYMVDSRGAVVTPQIMQPVYSQPTHPFLYAPPGAPSGSNGAGPSRNNFDLNSGFMGDLGNRENNGGLGLRQFFNTNQNEQQQLQQYLRINNNNNNNNSLQASSSSVIGGKRMEPETGWDLFPVNYKHHQSQSQHHQNQNQQPPWQ
ncbi:hypothetical protein LXL04_015088 [Taraxacum kok-saghyz]